MKKKASLIILIIIGALLLFLSGRAGLQLWDYFRLSKQAPARTLQLDIMELSESKYVICVSYAFKVNNKEYLGKTLFKETYYLNRYSAMKELDKWRNLKWDAWYSRGSPNHNSLQKIFPFKSCIQAALVLGVFVYFLCLGAYSSRFSEIDA